jgi:hypothetical protein
MSRNVFCFKHKTSSLLNKNTTMDNVQQHNIHKHFNIVFLSICRCAKWFLLLGTSDTIFVCIPPLSKVWYTIYIKALQKVMKLCTL